MRHTRDDEEPKHSTEITAKIGSEPAQKEVVAWRASAEDALLTVQPRVDTLRDWGGVDTARVELE